MPTEDNLRLGVARKGARRHAMLKLGGVEQLKEEYRGRRGWLLGWAIWTRRAKPVAPKVGRAVPCAPPGPRVFFHRQSA